MTNPDVTELLAVMQKQHQEQIANMMEQFSLLFTKKRGRTFWSTIKFRSTISGATRGAMPPEIFLFQGPLQAQGPLESRALGKWPQTRGPYKRPPQKGALTDKGPIYRQGPPRTSSSYGQGTFTDKGPLWLYRRCVILQTKVPYSQFWGFYGQLTAPIDNYGFMQIKSSYIGKWPSQTRLIQARGLYRHRTSIDAV